MLRDMKRILLITVFLLCITGSASAYQLYLSCPESVQVGLTLNCSVDSNLPAGTTFDLLFYQSVYIATPFSRMPVTIPADHSTVYRSIDTKGLPGGLYKVEARFYGPEEGKLSSDSITLQAPKIIDRSGDITITSPLSQAFHDALRIEGSIDSLGKRGVRIEVRGPEGFVFGPEYIDTKIDVRSGAGVFTLKAAVMQPGEYDVYFKDEYGYLGVKTFRVLNGVSQVPASVPAATPSAAPLPTTVPPLQQTPTQSPLSLFSGIAALCIIGLLFVIFHKRR